MIPFQMANSVNSVSFPWSRKNIGPMSVSAQLFVSNVGAYQVYTCITHQKVQYSSQATWQTSASDTRVWSACSRVNFRQPRVPGTRVLSARARSRGHTQVFETRQQKNLASSWATCRYSFTASLLSTSLLKLSKSLMPQLLTITFTSTRDSSWKSTENRKLVYA